MVAGADLRVSGPSRFVLCTFEIQGSGCRTPNNLPFAASVMIAATFRGRAPLRPRCASELFGLSASLNHGGTRISPGYRVQMPALGPADFNYGGQNGDSKLSDARLMLVLLGDVRADKFASGPPQPKLFASDYGTFAFKILPDASSVKTRTRTEGSHSPAAPNHRRGIAWPAPQNVFCENGQFACISYCFIVFIAIK